MKLFECQNCAQPLYFENTHCESCGLSLGYSPDHDAVTALKPHGNVWTALADPRGTYRYCANAVHNVCNWLVLANSPEQFCAACRHNRVIPDLGQPEYLERWRLIEIAKHRLFYTLRCQFAESEHGSAGPLPFRAEPARDLKAHLRP
jgi:hypothetical protein